MLAIVNFVNFIVNKLLIFLTMYFGGNPFMDMRNYAILNFFFEQAMTLWYYLTILV